MDILTENLPQPDSGHLLESDTSEDSEMSVYQAELKTICSKIAEEFLLITVNAKDNSCTYIASQTGKKFLSEKIELLKQFFELCQDGYVSCGEDSTISGKTMSFSETFHFDSKSDQRNCQSKEIKKKVQFEIQNSMTKHEKEKDKSKNEKDRVDDDDDDSFDDINDIVCNKKLNNLAKQDKQEKNFVDGDDVNFDIVSHPEYNEKRNKVAKDTKTKNKYKKNKGKNRDSDNSKFEEEKHHDLAVLCRSNRKRTAPAWTKSYICSDTKKPNQLMKAKREIFSADEKSEKGDMKISDKNIKKRSNKVDGNSDGREDESCHDDSEISHSDHDYLSTNKQKKATKTQKLEKSKQNNVVENSIFVCPYCSKEFVQCRYLSVHMATVHMAKCSICKICGKMFDSKQNLMNHKIKHQDQIQNNKANNETEEGEIYGQDHRHAYKIESDGEDFDFEIGSDGDQNIKEQDNNEKQKAEKENDDSAKEAVNIFVEKIDLLPSNKNTKSEMTRENDVEQASLKERGEGGDTISSCDDEIALVKHSSDVKNSEDQHLCSACKTSFKSHSELQSHLKFCKKVEKEQDKIKFNDGIQPDVKEKYECGVCGKFLLTKLSLRAHKNIHSNKKYSCRHCSKKFTLSRYLHLHLKTIHKDSSSICRFCDKIFKSAYELKQHYYSNHQTIIQRPKNPLKKFFTCNICRKMCHTEASLQKHKLQHLLGSDLTYICPFCDKVFSKTIYLSDHLYRIHNEKRSICRICKQFFKTKMELRRHLSVHNLKNPNTCNLCGKFFTSLSEKLEHKRSHTSKPEYICEFCGKVFGRGFDLNIHRRIHSGEKPFLCSICDASFVSKSRLISHERVHTTSRPHLCDICGQSFKILPALSRHKRRHTNESEKFKCEHCEREFLSTEGLHGHLLHQHINLIDLSKINFKYRKCEYCDQIFAQKHKYDRHIIGHTGQNPVSCEICGKGYPNVASLNRHKYSHNSVKRFWCDICESGTNSKTKLKKHFNSQKHRSNCEKKGVLIKEERGRKTGLSELIEIASKEILETRNMSSDSRIIQPLEISSNGSLTTSALQETDKVTASYNGLENNEQTIDISNLDIETTECVIISLPENISMATIGDNEIIYDILQVEQQ